MNDKNYDYSQYVDQVDSSDVLGQIYHLAEEQRQAEKEVARISEELERAQQRVRDLAEFKIPELMDKVGQTELKMKNGLKVEISETVHAGIAKAREHEAYAWLRANGHSALIKRVFSIPFSAGQDERAAEVAKLLEEHEVETEDKSSIHHTTLRAFVAEQLARGVEIPLDLFGVHRRRVAKLSTPE